MPSLTNLNDCCILWLRNWVETGVGVGHRNGKLGLITNGQRGERIAVITGKKILVTGGAGMMGRPVAEMLAPGNEVWVASLFDASEAKERKALEALGIKTFAWDMANQGIDGLPDDF